jgi:hypothetical protein
MKPKELFERTSTNILVVDVQPAYRHHCNKVVGKICRLLNDQTGQIVVLFNDEEMTNDALYDVQQYYIDHGLNPELIEDGKIKFIEKQYAFFRGFMDNGVDDHIILKTIRAMVMQRKNDSRDMALEDILTPEEYSQVSEIYDSIWLPDYVDIAMFRKMSPFYMCGGGRSECLREIELACNAFNIRYKRMDSLIYG